MALVCLFRTSKYQVTFASLPAAVLTGDHTGDFGQKALDSADGNSTCFVILHSCNDVFNLSKERKDFVVYALTLTYHECFGALYPLVEWISNIPCVLTHKHGGRDTATCQNLNPEIRNHETT